VPKQPAILRIVRVRVNRKRAFISTVEMLKIQYPTNPRLFY